MWYGTVGTVGTLSKVRLVRLPTVPTVPVNRTSETVPPYRTRLRGGVKGGGVLDVPIQMMSMRAHMLQISRMFFSLSHCSKIASFSHMISLWHRDLGR